MLNSTKTDLLVCLVLAGLIGGYLLINEPRISSQARPSSNWESIAQRYNSFEVGLKYVGLEFPAVEYFDAVSEKEQTSRFTGKTVLILLSNSNCNPGQVRELEPLSSLHGRFEGEVRFAAIYYAGGKSELEARIDALRLRKLAASELPIGYTTATSIADFLLHGAYPIVLALEGQKVIFSYTPLAQDDVFSEKHMNALARSLL